MRSSAPPRSLIESGYVEQKPGARKQIAALNVINQSHYGAPKAGKLAKASRGRVQSFSLHASLPHRLAHLYENIFARGSRCLIMAGNLFFAFLRLLPRFIDVHSPFSMWSELQFDSKSLQQNPRLNNFASRRGGQVRPGDINSDFSLSTNLSINFEHASDGLIQGID